MNPDQAVGLAAHALGRPPASFGLLHADEAVTLALDDQVVRVMGQATATGLPVARWTHLLAGISPVLVAPLGPPVLVEGAAIVVFPRLPLDGLTELDPVAAGAALARLHAAGARWTDDPELPRFDPTVLADAWLERTTVALPAEFLARTRTALVEAWRAVDAPAAVLHGDAHAANWRGATAGDWRLVDAEYLSVGPAVYDLAPLEVVDRRLGAGPARFDVLRRAYVAAGGVVDDGALAAAIRTRELLSAAWYAAREPDGERVRRRLEDAIAGAPGSWQPLDAQR